MEADGFAAISLFRAKRKTPSRGPTPASGFARVDTHRKRQRTLKFHSSEASRFARAHSVGIIELYRFEGCWVPSLIVKIWFVFTFSSFSIAPLGLRISIASALLAVPRPKCKRKSLCEM